MDLTDEQVLAELRKDELRVWHAPVTTVGGRHLQTVFRNTFTRLALSRIEAREAAAREREACAAICDAYRDGALRRQRESVDSGDEVHWMGRHYAASDMAARIRARGQS